MKRRLHFRITTKLGNSKRQHCSWQEKIYTYVQVRAHCLKKPAKEKKKKRTRKSFCSYMNNRNASYAQGANVYAHFWEAQ